MDSKKMDTEIKDSILKIKSKLKKRDFENKYQISKYVLQNVLNKWDENEAILNLTSRIKEVELENGLLKSEVIELMDLLSKYSSKKTSNITNGEYNTTVNLLNQRIFSLEHSTKKAILLQEVHYSILLDIIHENNIDIDLKTVLKNKKDEFCNRLEYKK